MNATNIYREQVNSWYSTFYEKFLAMGLGFGLDIEEVKDVLNQYFLDLLEKNIDPAAISSHSAYLTTGFKRRLIDRYHLNKKGTLPLSEAAMDEVAEVPCRMEAVQQNTILLAQIQQAYKNLPARCQRVIYLKFYEGKTTEQIALETGLTKRTVYNNLFEGIKLLRQELNDVDPGIQLHYLMALLPVVLAQV